MTRLWIVRAGQQGERELAAIEQSRLMPGFVEIDDLSACTNREEIAVLLRRGFPNDGENRVRNFAAQLNQFVRQMTLDDLVVMPRKLTNGVAIGRVTGDYSFDPAAQYRHFRTVEWAQTSVARDVFRQDLRHSFGAFMTICEIQRNNALHRVQAVLASGIDPGPMLGNEGKAVLPPADRDADADEVAVDIEDLANQQIISLIRSEFAGHALADLVAEILRIEGYTTRVSQPGPDEGVDILAAGGTLGLGEDRICVQVKSGDDPANHNVVLRLMGSVANTQAQTGLLVSIGGVNGPAQRELDNNFFKLRLWQMADLLRALFRTYDRLSDETRAKLPLKQIWSPLSGRGA